MTANSPNSHHPIDPALLHPKRGLRARLFARMMAQVDDVHGDFIIPYKRRLLGDLHGDLLEIGPGAGPNFAYYAADVHWTGVEPNPYMHPYLRANAATQGRTIDLRTGYTEALPVEDESMDVVVSTLVLCSVYDLDVSLAEVRRVLRPGGKFVFIEHVAATTGSGLRRVQNWLQPLWSFAADGCHPNREIWRYLEEAGFARLELEHFNIDVPVVKPHIAGYAVK
ncbi:MAG: class I SAM-dependent methyltransferase [Caldilineaceae bacterium]|nr:class I SAM-dependent methyltransferase [Caldilineaceae bacterium]